MIELNDCYYSILLIHSPLIILPTFHSCIFVITYYLIYYVLHILLSTINLCTIYSSEIAISQVPDGASLILLFEYPAPLYEKRSSGFAIFTDLFAFNQAQTMFAHREAKI